MKKWILGLLLFVLALYLLMPGILDLAGLHSSRFLLYNGHNDKVKLEINGTELEFIPGQSLVLRSSRFRNTLRYQLDGKEYVLKFGSGQHIVNMGTAPLHVQEVYYYWDENKQAFFPRDSKPHNRLLLDADIGQGVQTLDNCWDCCLILPPGERPYKYLIPENKDKRFFVCSVM
jgi:hypothetical protein